MSEQSQNRLKDSASAYLRSAAHQPIDWHEWGEQAFTRARAEDKPLLLDIGAVWCHWCHVIDRESYENPEIAEIINRFYVPVKVDRDERPDVDARYQAAISAISGQGGWPLTGFLTPDGRPFFGGTYFPPEDSMGRPGFKRVLLAIAQAYREKRADVERSAQALFEAVAQAEAFQGARGEFNVAIVDHLVEFMLQMRDTTNGGFGRAPKFPHPAALDLLLEWHQATADPRLAEFAELTLVKMARGGVYDQLGGGFHRYSVDERWLVPHFEKMSYDNSELLRNYLHGYQVTRNPFLREVAEGILGWVDEVLSDRARGGFYASQDADYSLDDDGDYFTWTREEARAVLSPDEARAVELHYDIEERGEMHHNPAKNVLWIARDPAEIAQQTGMSEADVRLALARAKGKLLEARRRRPTPFVDTTVYVSWNAMFVSAYLDAWRALGRADCLEFARKTLDRLLAEAWDDAAGFAHRVAEPGAPRLAGMLDDQVFAAAALLDAYEATLDRRYFDVAERAMRIALEKYFDVELGGFFDRPADAPPLGGLDVRRKPFQDSPTPGSNSMAAVVLDRLYAYTGRVEYRDAAEKTMEAFAGIAPQYGLFAAMYGLAAVLHARHPVQVVVTGAAGDPQAARLEKAAADVFRYGKALLRVTPEAAARDALAPALKQTIPRLDASKPQALVCVETTCHPPTSDPAGLVALLTQLASSAAVGR
jgi:hypothetical protein